MPSKILVIDDERPTLSMFALFLEAYGFEVFTAASGEEGIALFKEHAIPIVLTDIKMPGMDGLEVLRTVKALDPAAEVIVITGHGDMDLAIKALGLGATDFINKPISQPNLDAALKRARERFRSSRDEDRGYEVRRLGETAVIAVRGEINSKSEERLETAFAEALTGARRVVLNFGDQASINGAGMALLTQQLIACRDRGIPVGLYGLTAETRKVIDMVGIGKLARVCSNEQEALDDR